MSVAVANADPTSMTSSGKMAFWSVCSVPNSGILWTPALASSRMSSSRDDRASAIGTARTGNTHQPDRPAFLRRRTQSNK